MTEKEYRYQYQSMRAMSESEIIEYMKKSSRDMFQHGPLTMAECREMQNAIYACNYLKQPAKAKKSLVAHAKAWIAKLITRAREELIKYMEKE